MSHNFLCDFSGSKRHKDNHLEFGVDTGKKCSISPVTEVCNCCTQSTPSERNETVALTKLYKFLLYAVDYWPSGNQIAFALFGNLVQPVNFQNKAQNTT